MEWGPYHRSDEDMCLCAFVFWSSSKYNPFPIRQGFPYFISCPSLRDILPPTLLQLPSLLSKNAFRYCCCHLRTSSATQFDKGCKCLVDVLLTIPAVPLGMLVQSKYVELHLLQATPLIL